MWTSSEAYVIDHQLKASIDASGASDERCPATAAMSASALLRGIARQAAGWWILDFGIVLNAQSGHVRFDIFYFNLLFKL